MKHQFSDVDKGVQRTGTRIAEDQDRNRTSILTIEEKYEYALSCVERGNLAKAISYLTVVVRENPGYKDAAGQLQKARENFKQEEYEAGCWAFDNTMWAEAIDHFKRVYELDRNFRDVASYLKRAEEGLKLPKRYDTANKLLEEAEKEFQSNKWTEAIQILQEVVEINKEFRSAVRLLDWAERRKQIAQQYEDALKQYDRAQQEGGERVWREAIAYLEKVNRIAPHYKDIGKKLTKAKTQLELAVHYNQGSQHLGHHQGKQAFTHLSKVYRIDPTYGDDIREKLQEARQILNKQQGMMFRPKLWKRLRDLFMDLLRRLIAIIIDKTMEIIIVGIGAFLVAIIGGGALLSIQKPNLTPTEQKTTPTATPLVSPTPTTLTLTPTSTSIAYPAPTLVSPEEGTLITKGQNVKLEWEWEQGLAGNEFFEVRIWLKGEQEFEQMDMIRASYQFVPASKLTQAGTYEWQVAIISLSREERGASQIWSFEVR